MRYTLNTSDEQGMIGIQIHKWEKEGKVQIIEKSETLVEIEAKLERVASALTILKKAGYNSEVMKIYLQHKTKCSMRDISDILQSQNDFLKQIGALR